MNHSNEDNSFTFKVDDVEPNRDLQPETCLPKDVIRQRVDKSNFKFDDFSHKNDTKTKLLTSDKNGLMAAAHFAYINHYPLKISVSDFILMISQGLAAHMEVHAEDVRPLFVNHEGKEKIIISRPDFHLEGGNDWSTVFGEFAEGIKESVNMDFYDIMVDDTSVATKLSRISSEIAIVDTFKHYFEFIVLRGCAITEVTLVGSRDDWEKLRTKVHKLKEFNQEDRLYLDWWLDRLVPLVDQIVDQAVSRKIDTSFWSKIYQSHESEFYEPIPYVNGWLNVFCPYILKARYVPNSNPPQKSRATTRSTFESIHPDELMNGVSKAPVTLEHALTKEKHPMTVYGGFLGAKLNDDGTVGTEYFFAATFDDCPENEKIRGIDFKA